MVTPNPFILQITKQISSFWPKINQSKLAKRGQTDPTKNLPTTRIKKLLILVHISSHEYHVTWLRDLCNTFGVTPFPIALSQYSHHCNTQISLSASAADPHTPINMNTLTERANLGQLGIHIPIPTNSWDSSSSLLAVAAGSNIYSVNNRPNYKFTFYAGRIIAYAFGFLDGSTHIGFWDQHKLNQLNVQDVPGLVIDMKGNDELCAILTCSRNGVYNVFLVNDEGLPVDHIAVLNVQPFSLVLTETTVCCVARNAVHIWKHKLMNVSQSGVSRKRERMFHLDDTAINVGGNDFEQQMREPVDYSNKPTEDSAVCADGVNHVLVVVRESGKIMLYSLPHGTFISCMESILDMNIRPKRVFLNVDGTQMALLDSSGALSTCNLRGEPEAKIYDRRDIWDMMWARDNPSQFCIMERENLYVIDIDNEILEEPIISSASLAYFKNLMITSISMDKIMQFPQTPEPTMVLKYETRALQDMKFLIASNAPTRIIQTYVEENNHPVLWDILAQTAIQRLDFEVAETAFVKCKDYSGIQLVKRVSTIPDELIQKAEVACFLEHYERAERLYLRASRRDLAIEMWLILGDPKRVEILKDLNSKEKIIQKPIPDQGPIKGPLTVSSFEWRNATAFYEDATVFE